MTGNEKLVAVGLGTAVVIGVTVLAYSVSECRRLYGRWSRVRDKDDREEIRVEAARKGCDWPSKVA